MDWFKKLFYPEEDRTAGKIAAEGVSLPPFEKAGYRDNARPANEKESAPIIYVAKKESPAEINGGILKRKFTCECKKGFPTEKQCRELGIEVGDIWTCSKCKFSYKRDNLGWWNGESFLTR